MLAHDDSNGELWNLQGILLAQTGDYLKATLSFEKARGLFMMKRSSSIIWP